MSLVNSADTLERLNEKLLTIAKALMRKVEQKNDQSGIAYAQFERVALLEVQVLGTDQGPRADIGSVAGFQFSA